MKNTTWELQGGLTFQLPTPETIDEYNSLAGVRPADPNETGIAVLDDAIENTMYRGPFADIRKAVALAVEKEYSDIPRNRKPHPNAEKAAKNETVFNESEGKYIARVAAEKGVDISSFQPVLDKIVADNAALPDTDKNKIKLDPSTHERRGPSSTEPGKLDIETAKALIAQGNKKLKISLSKLKDVAPAAPVIGAA